MKGPTNAASRWLGGDGWQTACAPGKQEPCACSGSPTGLSSVPRGWPGISTLRLLTDRRSERNRRDSGGGASGASGGGSGGMSGGGSGGASGGGSGGTAGVQSDAALDSPNDSAGLDHGLQRRRDWKRRWRLRHRGRAAAMAGSMRAPTPVAARAGGADHGGLGDYCIDSTEVTESQYAAFITAKGSDTSGQPAYCAWNTSYAPRTSGGCTPTSFDPTNRPNHPVKCVDWCDAYAYCAWAGKRLCGRVTGGPLTPGSALGAWQAACSREGTRAYPYGNNYIGNYCVSADYDGVSGYQPSTDVLRPVASLPTCEGGYPGIWDMSGNLWEWEDSCDASSGADDTCQIRGSSFQQGDREQRHRPLRLRSDRPSRRSKCRGTNRDSLLRVLNPHPTRSRRSRRAVTRGGDAIARIKAESSGEGAVAARLAGPFTRIAIGAGD